MLSHYNHSSYGAAWNADAV